MRILVMSDVHVEFHCDWGQAFIRDLPSGDEVDVVVLAGDIDAGATIPTGVELFCRRYKHVVYVTGNHEYYHSSPSEVHRKLDVLGRRYPNFHWLLNKTVEIEGQRFLGSTLWFPDCPSVRAVVDRINDPRLIDNFDPWAYRQNGYARSFFMTNVTAGDIVVTHHAPSYRSAAPRFRQSSLGVLFADSHEDLIREAKPALWIHGHMHSSSDYLLGETRVVCNPFGYARREENPRFDWAKVIEIDR